MTSEVTSDLNSELSGPNNPCSSAFLASKCFFEPFDRRKKGRTKSTCRPACSYLAAGKNNRSARETFETSLQFEVRLIFSVDFLISLPHLLSHHSDSAERRSDELSSHFVVVAALGPTFGSECRRGWGFRRQTPGERCLLFGCKSKPNRRPPHGWMTGQKWLGKNLAHLWSKSASLM